MSLTVGDKEIETNQNGYLVNAEDWSQAVAIELAKTQDVELTEKHWNLINYLRSEFLNHNGNQPNTRSIVKAMADIWTHENVSAKSLYQLFPKDPSKQAGMIAGLPESRRKGGY